MKRAATALMAALILSCGAAQAEQPPGPYDSVLSLMNQCKGNVGPSWQMYCYGLVSGLIVGLRSTQYACAPEGATIALLAQIFINWAEKNPKEWEQFAKVGLAKALHEAHPCK